MLPHERGLNLERTARQPSTRPDFQLALLHVRLPRVALPVRTGPALRGRTKIRARDAQIPLPDCARLLQRRLHVIFRTAPILVASSATRRAIATPLMWRQNFDRAKKTQFSARSHIGRCHFLHVVIVHVANHASSRGQSSCFCRSSRAHPMLPGHSSGCLCPISLLCQIQVH